MYGRYSAQRDECVSNQDRIFNLESAGMIDIAPKEIVWPEVKDELHPLLGQKALLLRKPVIQRTPLQRSVIN